jgi:hypothetical protein
VKSSGKSDKRSAHIEQPSTVRFQDLPEYGFVNEDFFKDPRADKIFLVWGEIEEIHHHKVLRRIVALFDA